MSAIAFRFREMPTFLASLARRSAVPVSISAIAFLGYYLSSYLADRQLLELVRLAVRPDQDWCAGDVAAPGCWYQHYVYLADAISHGTLDVASAGIPDFYQDTVTIGGSKYLPFPPGPAVLLLPFVAVWGTNFSQVYFSMALGAINVALLWYLLGLLNISTTTKLLLVPFFAFGTAHFYAATTGTAWFFGHVAAVFFLLLALITLFRKAPPIVPAIFLGFAFMSREPTVLAAPVFLYWLFKQRHDTVSVGNLLDRKTIYRLGSFCAGLLPFVIFWFAYNIARFDAPLDTGYDTVANGYIGSGIPYSFYLSESPDAPRFNLFDIRNIPLHLYTMFLMPPQFVPNWDVFRPSPYGMSVLLTSPAFIYAGLVKRKSWLKPSLWIAIAFVSVPLLLHYSQGWVQFGYRFLLDFTPFLLILTAFGFDDNTSPGSRRWQIALVAVAVLAGFWGRYWANKLGW